MPCTGIHELPSGPIEFPELIYSFVICDDKVVMIDAGVANSIMDVNFLDKIDYLVITHLHIDHLGLLPEIVSTYNPKILVFQGYKKYLENPEKINSTAREVLGNLVDIYGEVKPIKGNIIEVSGGEEINIGKNVMKIFYTPGHAKHHISVMIGDVLYTGDSAGGRYNGIPFPTTPPPLDLEKYIKSLEFQISLKPRIVGLSHGGLVNAIHLKEHYKQMIEGKYKVNIQLGGEKDQILNKHLEINYKGIELAKDRKK
ncbi:MBL fold metallo-hydrolase [Acidianus sulfidivorans JP7]|uniref:MBL fold metallo-hydrolase n=1 Tax=Acidianus sulfidivorans JP7 TaxID=619593 RepID=A0A2U9IJZ6_9CREN|nr:MBL fold metallo-hydrolase [Acidianus sulfidivorans]AWR96372.1 MBL fold metallo-hydrolase [Acidianus sulfidivorans JP7]